MWTLYDKLIEAIPGDKQVDEAVPGDHWTMVRSGDGVGLAMSMAAFGETRPRTLPEPCAGMPLRRLAAAAKSWNFAEAALGMAAINAWWNSPDHEAVARSLEGEDVSAFDRYRERVRGKKTAVVGHFRHL
jgi:uncharacterized protein (DUF4213/DUF364 family)